MFEKLGRFMVKYLDRIEVVVLLAMLCYLVGVALMLHYGLR